MTVVGVLLGVGGIGAALAISAAGCAGWFGDPRNVFSTRLSKVMFACVFGALAIGVSGLGLALAAAS
jgi:hypothetical protein